MKNIPIAPKHQYLEQFLAKMESFIKRLRWKAFFFDNKFNNEVESDKKPTYGFKSEHCPPQHKALTLFKNDMYDLAKNIRFRKTGNKFQQHLNEDIKSIKQSESPYFPADKTTNIYKVKPDDYNKLLNDNITAVYKRTDENVVKSINKEAQTIAYKLDLHDRIECHSQSPALIALKDHKDGFVNNPKCRLLNPAKTQIGKVSKIELDNTKLSEHLPL